MNTNIDFKKIVAAIKNLDKKTLTIIASATIAIPLVLFGGYFAFNTFQQRVIKAQDSTPENVSSSVNKGSKSVNIRWQSTGTPTDAIIEYGTDPSNLSSIAYSKANDGGNASSIPTDNLKSNSTYYFRIKVEDKTYDNNGALWSFQTGETTSINEATPSASLAPTVVIPTPTPTAIVTILPTPTIASSSSSLVSATCGETSCTKISAKFGLGCGTTDYIKAGCVSMTGTVPTEGPSPTEGPTNTPTATPTTVPSTCSISYLQANSCSSWVWDDIMTSKTEACTDTYKKYFVQCKSSSFSSSDSSTWFCNQTQTSNQLTFPCGNAPTPFPGQSVFCRMRGETEGGGDSGATDWIYGNTSCNKMSAIPACAITYLQSNNCRDWIWDLVNSKLPACTSSFDHYFLQCKNQSFTSSETAGRWFCNGTVKTHYTSMGSSDVCGNGPTPADGENIYCRVRAEDAYNGANQQYSDWTSNNDICPTSTPTPTPTDTPTNTPTPTRTPTP